MNNFLYFLMVFLFLLAVPLRAQIVSPPDTTQQEQVVVDHADVGEYIVEGNRQIQMLMKQKRQVELRHGDAFMYCDTAIIEENDVVAYGNVIIQQGDSLNVFADSVVYLGNTRTADFFGGVVLETGDQRLFTEALNYNLNTKVATYYSGAMITNDQTQLTSKRGYYYVEQKEAFFKDSVIVIDEEFSLQADTLKYNTASKVATFLGPTLIRQDSAKIYCEDGFYDTAGRKAEFTKNAQYVKGEQKATAKVIRYDGAKSEVTLEGDAQFIEGAKHATADVIRYDDKNDLTFLEGNAVYQDDKQLLKADKIRYDAVKESFKAEGRSRIFDEAQILEADQIDFDTEANIGIATGNVYWIDTVEQVTIRCENANYNKSTDYLKATGGRPLMTTLVDGDTLYLAADTLISYRVVASKDTLAGTTDTLVQDSLVLVDTALVVTDSLAAPGDSTQGRNLIAQRNVKIFKSDMQAVCDSLTYSTVDSLFEFYGDPIIWSDTSQFSADVIHLQMAQKQIDKIFLYQNAFILNSPDELFFNQIKGRNIIAFFKDSEIRRVQVNGNAESVYYALDENKAYVAVNKTVSSEMMLFFGSNEIEKINFYRKPTAVMYPMGKVDHKTLELPGFNWAIQRRPLSVVDLKTIASVNVKLPEETEPSDLETSTEEKGEN